MLRSLSDPAMSLAQLNITAKPENGGNGCGKCIENESNKPDFTDKEAALLTLKDFNLMGIVGLGGFGKIMFAEHSKTKKVYALKAMNRLHIVRPRIGNIAENEISIHKDLSSPFIIQFHAAFKTPNWVCVLMDLACNCNLQEFAAKMTKKLTPRVKRFFLAEILLGIKYLHENDIAHRDIKCENVLLSGEGHVKLADFGFALGGMTAETTTNVPLGTPACTAPEVYKNMPYTRACDIWSYGIAVFELLTFTSPIPVKAEEDIKKFICDINDCNTDVNVSKLEDGNAYDLVRNCLQFEKDRISIAQIQAHDFFKDTLWSKLHKKKHSDTSYFEIHHRDDYDEPMFPKHCDCLQDRCICNNYNGRFT